MISDWSHGNPLDVPRNSIFFSWTGVRLCTELQDITIERQFPLYSVQIPPECQIPRSVRRNSGTQAGFWAEYQGESKDLLQQHHLSVIYHAFYNYQTRGWWNVENVPTLTFFFSGKCGTPPLPHLPNNIFFLCFFKNFSGKV